MRYGNLLNDTSQRRALEALLAGENELPAGALGPGSVPRSVASVLAGLSGAVSAGAANALLRRLNSGQSATLLVLGDSTGNATTEWVYLLGQQLAARFPAYNVDYYLWPSSSASAYDTAIAIASVSGGPTLSIYNCSVGGMNCRFHLGETHAIAQIAATNAHLVIVNHGHNQTITTANQPQGDFLALFGVVRTMLPSAGLMTILQNPQITSGAENTVTTEKIPYIETAARAFGVEVVDVWSVIRASSLFPSGMADDVHPGSDLMPLWVDAVLRHFEIGQAQQLAPGFERRPNLLLNGNFESWSDTNPANWSVSGSPTVAKETSLKETGTHALKVTSAATSDYVSQTITNVAYLKNRCITLCVRIRNSASTLGNARARLQFSSSASLAPNGNATYNGEYAWLCISGIVPSDASYVSARLYPDTSTVGGVAYFDRVWLGIGCVVGDDPYLS